MKKRRKDRKRTLDEWTLLRFTLTNEKKAKLGRRLKVAQIHILHIYRWEECSKCVKNEVQHLLIKDVEKSLN